MSARRILGYVASIVALVLGAMLLVANLTAPEVVDSFRYNVSMALGGIGVAVGIIGPILLKRFSR